ncbi:hypothetical protein SB6411_02405 [Klebsiella spallanzanii]|uniref:Uncharacterized protein n=1 Tax=Klebsiella spallanzanii TaxID=2587528 RepID=A0ABY6VFF3_9ENTR|nr:hypothetical protein SB6411_02405 [Klebsiella spallanzanii]
MKTVVKTAVAAALVMGFASFANAAGTNTGTVTFTGILKILRAQLWLAMNIRR